MTGGIAMPTVKTAISLDKELYEEAEALADEQKVSRSRLYALALEEYLRRHESRLMLRELNAVYEAGPDENERALTEGMARQQRRIVEGEW
jgi:metal-responsive CopG/Arc/MetJ family transcriptional regulator